MAKILRNSGFKVLAFEVFVFEVFVFEVFVFEVLGLRFRGLSFPNTQETFSNFSLNFKQKCTVNPSSIKKIIRAYYLLLSCKIWAWKAK